MILDKINGPEDIRRLSLRQMELLAGEIRQVLVDTTSRNGGHLASNLGVVELTIAMYRVFDFPRDKVVWDVGHQSYTHKLLSGRKQGFYELRKYGGLSGFPKRRESEYDTFDTGHSSTSISAGLGIAQARDLLGEDYNVISVIGDGALTGGMAYEALNNVSQHKSKYIIILNDNNMSISHNVGGMHAYLTRLRSAGGYNNLKAFVKADLNKIPVVGPHMVDSISRTKNSIKQLVISDMFFENMGVTYLGPVDGHDIREVSRILKEAKKMNKPCLIHLLTCKGKGYKPAEDHPEKFHGVGPFDVSTGKPVKPKTKQNYTDVFAETMCELGAADPKIVGVTAAMPDGTGLSAFGKKFPKRFFDVGIAEEHAVTNAAGMAAAGMKPVVAVYSSFLQRAFDQIMMDVCLQELPVVFCIDRAGLVGSDGETHQGILDLTYMSAIPNMTVMAPKNKWELKDMLRFAVNLNRPVSIRYPRGEAYEGLKEFREPVVYGKGECLYEEQDIALLAVGSMVSTAEHIREKLHEKKYHCSLYNGRFIKPIDTDLIDRIAEKHTVLITLEENIQRGGFGEQVFNYAVNHHPGLKVYSIHLPDAYVEHGSVTHLRSILGIDSDSIMKRIREKVLPDIDRMKQSRGNGTDGDSD